ncbi:hypothetical protein PSEUDO8AS_20103 [Pseudomonas sp. 8AS]|nr:hypothetical protein PSEUDO8AS_20103 [Pseudomonas sp. 8AS]
MLRGEAAGDRLCAGSCLLRPGNGAQRVCRKLARAGRRGHRGAQAEDGEPLCRQGPRVLQVHA